MSTPLLTTRASLGTLDFSVQEASGVAWFLQQLDGWGSPKSTLDVRQRPRSHGGWAGAAFLQPRSLAASGLVTAPTAALLSDAIDRLNAAVSLDSTTLTVWEAGRARTCTVRRDDEVLVSDWVFDAGSCSAQWSIQLVATDPRKYGAALTASTNLPSSSGGLTWPITWPAVWSATQVTGVVTLTNPGNITGPVTLRINGPVTGPTVTHIGSGLTLTFSSSLTLSAGEWLTVDMEARTVLANGQASRSGWVTNRGWFGLEPGVNQFAYGAAVYNSTTTVQVNGWQTYL